jgi:hypothetical protein
MDMDQAAVFLAGSVLTVLGFLVILGGALIANNLVAKYWKSWGWKFIPEYMNQPSPTFMTHEEANRVAPILKEEDGKSK